MMAIGSAPAGAAPWEIWSSPYALARLDARDQVIEHSSHCPGGCRYDRDGAGPESPAANPYPSRWLYREGGELTVFDEPGPGALTRLWMTTGYGTSRCIDPAIRVRFYLDDAPSPVLDLPLPALFDGTTPPFVSPLVAAPGESSGGYVSHVPIAYAQHLRITLGDVQGQPNPCTGDDRHLLWYQFTHHRLARDVPVTSFDPGDDQAAYRAWLAHQGGDPWGGTPAAQAVGVQLAPGQSATLATRSGSGWLRGLRLHADPADLDRLHLRATFDGYTTIDLSLADFFARPADAVLAPRGVLSGVDQSGWLYAWFPMPYRDAAELELSLDPAPGLAAEVAGELAFDAAPVPDDAGTFFAVKSATCGTTDLPLLVRHGAGRLVAVAGRHRADGVIDANYLEADERVYVDGSPQPVWYGTGLEDFYGGGFYFDHGPFGTPLAGASRVDVAGTTSAWRLMPADGVVFHNGIEWRLEAGPAPYAPTPSCAETVFYGYATERPSLVPIARFELAEAEALIRHAYQAAPDTVCASVQGAYEDEPPTQRAALACRRTAGSSFFRFARVGTGLPLRLRRVFDASLPSAPADVLVNGAVVARLPFAPADPVRRWREQDVALAVPPAGDRLDVEIRPDFLAPGAAGGFGESAWELWAGWSDDLFGADFEPPP